MDFWGHFIEHHPCGIHGDIVAEALRKVEVGHTCWGRGERGRRCRSRARGCFTLHFLALTAAGRGGRPDQAATMSQTALAIPCCDKAAPPLDKASPVAPWLFLGGNMTTQWHAGEVDKCWGLGLKERNVSTVSWGRWWQTIDSGELGSSKGRGDGNWWQLVPMSLMQWIRERYDREGVSCLLCEQWMEGYKQLYKFFKERGWDKIFAREDQYLILIAFKKRE